MSNCILIRNNTVLIPDRLIDTLALKTFLAGLTDQDRHLNLNPSDRTPDQANKYIGAWFLKDTVEFCPGGVMIKFGQGRSTHTNRDFAQTVSLVNRFMTGTHVHTFAISDELDDFSSTNYTVVVFTPNKIQERLGL